MALEANGATSHRSGQVAAARLASRIASRVIARSIGPGLIAVAVVIVAALVHGQGAIGFQAMDDLAQLAAAVAPQQPARLFEHGQLSRHAVGAMPTVPEL